MSFSPHADVDDAAMIAAELFRDMPPAADAAFDAATLLHYYAPLRQHVAAADDAARVFALLLRHFRCRCRAMMPLDAASYYDTPLNASLSHYLRCRRRLRRH